ncbi:hypothetical protein ONZ45_g975 [Pleurotus djamor]|nr:hypothetical protein ONZ45_g975 [Pleurotus djamor]
MDKILGLGSPEPLARLYSPSYYRVTWITTGLDAGFATAMSVRPKWLRDICSILFSVYYIIYANEADEKLRRFRAVPTIEMLRATWEKTTHPLIRLFTHLPSIPVRRKILLPRPKGSTYDRPITAYLFYALPEKRLCKTNELILDFPGGGFVAMTPEHHEERLRAWAISTGRPVLAIDYGKAPEYPFPFANDEAYDTYRTIVDSGGAILGMSGKKLSVIVSGDSAGSTIAVNLVFKIIEHNHPRNRPPPSNQIPLPLSLVLNYAALDFNFTSWMTQDNLRILRSEQSSGSKWSSTSTEVDIVVKVTATRPMARRRHSAMTIEDRGSLADAESDDDEKDYQRMKEEDRPIEARVRHRPSIDRSIDQQAMLEERQKQHSVDSKAPTGIESSLRAWYGVMLTCVISMRAMAILYIGPYRNPDFATDYHISPILAPSYILAQFPPVLMQCGEKDPFVDDTVIFAGRVREAKRARKAELDLTISGKSTRFGEDLRMSESRSMSSGSHGHDDNAALRRERDRLSRETEDDWVEVVIFSDWSHGYLQMPSLMKEAKAVIEELGDWIDDAFRRFNRDGEGFKGSSRAEGSASVSGAGSETEAEESMITFVPKKYQGVLCVPEEAEEEVQELEAQVPVQVAEIGASSKRQSGPTITETELMRRRRLLDSHIFEQADV